MARARRGYRQAASALDPRAKVQLSGPFFWPNADDTLRKNIRGMMAAVADEGARAVKQRAPRYTGALAEGVEPRTSGRTRWAVTAAVVASHISPWGVHGSRGFSGRAQAQYRGGKAEARYRMFKGVTYQLRAARAVMAANITKGLERWATPTSATRSSSTPPPPPPA